MVQPLFSFSAMQQLHAGGSCSVSLGGHVMYFASRQYMGQILPGLASVLRQYHETCTLSRKHATHDGGAISEMSWEEEEKESWRGHEQD